MRRWFDYVKQCPILLILDAKVAYDCLSSEELPQDRRTALDIGALRESWLILMPHRFVVGSLALNRPPTV